MNEQMEAAADVANAPTIGSTLRVDIVKRVYKEDGICKLELFQTCADTGGTDVQKISIYVGMTSSHLRMMWSQSVLIAVFSTVK